MTAFKWVLAALMVSAGIMHFVWPKAFERVVPKGLPARRALVLVSGGFEVLGGIGLMVPVAQRAAAWGLMALFVAVFPANINMAVNRIGFGRRPTPTWLLWARLPLQAVLIAWAYLYT
ncbi:MAG TPA: DoxX family protein [Myxococcaceae bacterium]|nr:DoxX family protein [Myxococcaceae bacterium]